MTNEKNLSASPATSGGQALKADTLADSAFNRAALRLMPLLVLCYLSAFLDRVNVGFAALTMKEDIGLSSTAFGLGSGIFFLSYLLFEVPSNLALARFGARRWIARIMITWAVISAAGIFVWDGRSFLVVRFLLGAAEAGFYPGILVYLTQWFPSQKRAQIIAYLLLANPLATIVGGPVSGFILSHGDWGGLKDWQWLFIIEAVPALVLGFAVLYLLPDRISEAKWLSAEQMKAAEAVIDADVRSREKTASVAVSKIFTHPHVWALALTFFGISMTNATVNFWLPQMIKQSGFDVIGTGFISAIPYVCAVVGLLYWGRRSDRLNERRFHIIFPLLLSAAGLAVAACTDASLPRIAGLTVCATGLFALLPIFWSLPAQFMVGTAAAGGIAVVNSLGNLGGFFGPAAMGYVKDWTGTFGGGLFLDVIMLLVSTTIVTILTRR